MKLTVVRLSLKDFQKRMSKIAFSNNEKVSVNLKSRMVQQFDKFHNVYRKVSKVDKVDKALKKVDNCQLELTKFRESHIDYISELSRIRYELIILTSSIHEAERLQDDNNYLELKKRQRILGRNEEMKKNDYINLEKQEQMLKEALSTAKEHLHIIQRTQSDYIRYWGFVVALIGTFGSGCILWVRQKDDDGIKALKKELGAFLDELQKNKSESPGFLRTCYKYTGIPYVASWIWPQNKESTDNRNSYLNTVLKYSGVSYVYSYIRGK